MLVNHFSIFFGCSWGYYMAIWFNEKLQENLEEITVFTNHICGLSWAQDVIFRDETSILAEAITTSIERKHNAGEIPFYPTSAEPNYFSPTFSHSKNQQQNPIWSAWISWWRKSTEDLHSPFHYGHPLMPHLRSREDTLQQIAGAAKPAACGRARAGDAVRATKPGGCDGGSSWELSIFGYGSIPIDTFLVGWTSIYQLFWCSPGVQGFDPSPFHQAWDVNWGRDCGENVDS